MDLPGKIPIIIVAVVLAASVIYLITRCFFWIFKGSFHLLFPPVTLTLIFRYMNLLGKVLLVIIAVVAAAALSYFIARCIFLIFKGSIHLQPPSVTLVLVFLGIILGALYVIINR